jgi:hypothetical protein
MFPNPPPQRGAIASKNRSRRLFAVCRFFDSLKSHLPPDRKVEGFLVHDPNSEEHSISVAGLSLRSLSPLGIPIEIPSGEFAIISDFDRDEIPSLANISDEHLEALEKSCQKAKRLLPQKAAKRFHNLIYVAEHFLLAYEGDKQKTIKALRVNDLGPLHTLTVAYGDAGFPFEQGSEPLLRKLVDRDPKAKEIIDQLLKESPGRKVITRTREEERERTKQRKREYDARVRDTVKKIKADIARRIKNAKFSPTILKDPQAHRAAIAKLKELSVAPYHASKKKYEVKAARIVMKSDDN